jgi:hypothetical protein
MKPGIANLVCPQGSTFQRTLTFRIGRNAVDITEWTARMQVRERHESLTTLLELTSENESITLGGAAGTITLYVDSMITERLKIGTHVYDLELVNTTGEVTRLLEGKFTVTPEVTR